MIRNDADVARAMRIIRFLFIIDCIGIAKNGQGLGSDPKEGRSAATGCESWIIGSRKCMIRKLAKRDELDINLKNDV